MRRAGPPVGRDLRLGVVPRINAAGIADAELAIELMLEEDPARAQAMAEELEAVSERRRDMTRHAVDGARALVEADGGDWPDPRPGRWAPGLVGLVAGRLADSLARPVAVATVVGEEVRGSVRAPPTSTSPRHSKLAPSSSRSAAATRRPVGSACCPSHGRRSRPRSALSRPFPLSAATEAERPGRLVVDLVLPARLLDWSLADQLASLAPYGPGHVEPIVAVTGMVLTEARRVGAAEQHVSLRCVVGWRRSTRSPSASRRRGRCRSPVTSSTSSARWSATTSTACRAFGCGSSTSPTRRRACCWRVGSRRPGPRRMSGSAPRSAPGAARRWGRRSASASIRTLIGCPDGIEPTAQGIEAFARGVIEAAAPASAVMKINAAFFEAFGLAGWAALERTRADADVPCILDAKRGDIETSAERYAEAILGYLDADGVTVSPYRRGCEPFREAATGDRPVYILARTSNPSAGRFQSLVADGDPIHPRRSLGRGALDGRARRAGRRRDGPRRAGHRSARPPGPAFLVPGVGAQGGDASAAARAADGSWAPGLVNVSRGIASPHRARTGEAAAAAASAHAGRLADAVLHSEASPVRAGKIGGS